MKNHPAAPKAAPGPEEFNFRRAGLADSGTIASIVAEVSDGLVEELLGGLFPGLGSSDILSLAFGLGEGVYKAANVVLAEDAEEPRGLLFAYPSVQQGLPALAGKYLTPARLTRLENVLTASVPDTLWVNTLWVAENCRGRGLGGALLELAEGWAEQEALNGVSLYAWAAAKQSLEFYERCGFSVVRAVPASEPPVAGRQGPHAAGGFVLAKFKSK
ncbi:MAG: GNAT family N-acetyltransferase [Candidatus Adiutrix sp.]|jgi:GNAT superfamily N-acetyltransferase|nr:GNAT family N-acetyltransferase [Candidatus Adiutrix sp.]